MEAGSNEQGVFIKKTAISLLQERCMQLGMPPQYTLLASQGSVHEPRFVFQCNAGTFVGSGTGASKKKAKHMAAKEVLRQMDGVEYRFYNDESEEEADAVELDGHQGMHPVTSLQELCQKSGLSPPEYAYGAESTRGPQAGPLANNPGPHIFHATVTVDSWKERASGRNKRLAKRHAAAKLLKILRERTSRGGPVGSGGKELNEDECDDGDEFQEDENETFIPLVDQQMVPGGSPESFGAGLCSAFGPSTVSNAFRLITAHMQSLRNRSSEQAAASPAPAQTPAPPEGSKRLDDADEFASLFKLAKLSGRQPKTQAFEEALEALQPVLTTVSNNAAHVIELRNARGAKLKLNTVRVALRHPEKFFPSGFAPELQPLPLAPNDAAAAAPIDWSSATGAAKPSKWPSPNARRALYAANTPADAIAHLERVALVGGFTLSFLELGLDKQNRYAAMCSLGTQPAVVQSGTGDSSREARLAAASATLEHLRTIVFGPYAAGVLQSVDSQETIAVADD